MSGRRAVHLALLSFVFSWGCSPPSVAAPASASAAGPEGQSLSVSSNVNLDPAGETITVTGSGYRADKGVYVAFCLIPAPGVAPSPCGGGIDTTGQGGGSVWISSDPPAYGEGLAVPYGPNGSFEVTIKVAARINDDVDCTRMACAVVTRNDHTRTADRGQDVVVAVSFAGDGPGPLLVPIAVIGGLLALLGLGLVARRRRLLAAIVLPASIIAVLGCAAPLPTGPGSTLAADPSARAGCGPATATGPSDVEPISVVPRPDLPVTVSSFDGRSVTVTDASRILAVNLYGSIADIVFALGLGGNVIGRDQSTTFEAAAGLPIVTGASHDLSAETILELDPSIILTDGSIGPPEVLDQLRQAGIPIVVFDDQQTLAGLPAHIRAIAQALGVQDAGETLADRVAAEIEAARGLHPAGEEAPTIAFLYIRGTAGVYLMAGDGAGPDEMIEAIGAIDAGTNIGLSGFRPITTEALIAAAPNVILMMTEGLDSVGGVDGLLSQPGVADTPAGAARRIVDMDDGILLSFGSRTGRVLESLSSAVYRSC